jgi:hypothetical protein
MINNSKLYAKAKRSADLKFGKKTSAYKSAYLVRQYKNMGGTYSGPKSNRLSMSIKKFKKY